MTAYDAARLSHKAQLKELRGLHATALATRDAEIARLTAENAALREDKEQTWLDDTAKGSNVWELVREIQCTDGVPENIKRLAHMVERVKGNKLPVAAIDAARQHGGSAT